MPIEPSHAGRLSYGTEDATMSHGLLHSLPLLLSPPLLFFGPTTEPTLCALPCVHSGELDRRCPLLHRFYNPVAEADI